jgi:hypothetical protein
MYKKLFQLPFLELFNINYGDIRTKIYKYCEIINICGGLIFMNFVVLKLISRFSNRFISMFIFDSMNDVQENRR